MANLADDDLLLVQRTSAGISTNYSITGSALKEDLVGVTGLIVPPVEVLTPINGAGITEFDQYEPLSSAITTVGEAGTITKETDAIQSVADISNWNQSQTWSSGTYTGSQPPNSNYAVENAFNENGEDGGTFGAGDYWAIETGGEATLTFSSPITLSSNSTVEILAGNYEWIAANGGGMTFTCSNGSVPVTLNAVNNAVAKTTISDAYTTFGSQITAITLTAASNGWMSLVGLFVDGKRLVDAGIAGATITGKVLSFPTNTNFSELSVGDVAQAGLELNGTASVTQGYTFTDGRGNLDNLFNGVITGNGTSGADYSAHLVQPNDAGGLPCTLTFDPPLSARSGTLKAYVTRYSAGTVNYTINGSVGHSVYAAASPVEDDTGVTSISTFTFDSNTGNAQLWGFADGNGVLQHVDNVTVTAIDASATPPTITVDGGTWDTSDQSQVWSGGLTTPSNSFNGGQPATSAFDGDLETFAGAGSVGEDMVFQPTTPVSYSDSVEVYISGHAGQIILNSNSPVATTDSPGWVTLVSGSSGSISSITIDPNSNRRATITAIRVDGKLLVDTGTSDLGDKKISANIPYEKSLTFTDTTELANMVAPLEMADATGGNSLTPTTSNVVSASFTPSASFFNTTTYTGNASVNVQTFNTGVDMQNNGGMIWFKSRTSGQAARIIDTYRGTRPSLLPHSHSLNSALGADGLTFLDDGFSIGWEGNDIASANDYVAWSFREAAEFFDIVTWTGNGSSTREISHNLGSRPGFIIVKKTAGGSSRDWWCWHKSISTGDLSSNPLLRLNATNGITNPPSNSPLIGTASSTMFEIAGDDNVNGNGNTYIAYVFADNPSTQIKCSSYLGNATGGGAPAVPNQIECGFRPKFVLIKNAGNDTDWMMFDDERNLDRMLKANSSDEEGGSTPAHIAFNDTGFSLPTGYHYVNQDNTEHIFMAIGEGGSPDQTELTFQDNTALSALTSGMTITSNLTPTLGSLFSTHEYVGTNSAQTIDTGIDLAGEGGLAWICGTSQGRGHSLYDTERGPRKRISANGTEAEQDTSTTYGPQSFTSSGFDLAMNWSGENEGNGAEHVVWTFRKSPGFFDIQRWTGNGVGGRTIPHNLGSAPGMILAKRLTDSDNWVVYHKSLGATHPIPLNTHAAAEPITNRWNDAEPTSTEFTVGTWPTNSDGHEYVAYLFADDPSNEIKCGSYTGASEWGTPVEINLGFEPHWVLIKNSDRHGSNWVMLDSVRGWNDSPNTAGASQYVLANESQAESGGTLGWKTSTGFVVKDSSLVNGYLENFIYMAIGSPTGLSRIPTGTLIADADPSTNTAIVDATSWKTGDSVTGPSLSASLTSILEVSGNTIFGNGSTGTWMSGYYAEGSQVNDAPPGPSEITFTSQNQGTPAFSGVDATLASRTWTLESGTTATGPWTVVDTYVDYDVLNSQDGATPWSSNKPTLQPNTYYRIKVQYNSTNAESVESVYHTFKTGDA